MKNQVQDGAVLTLVAPYNVSSGDGFLVGMIFAVATTTKLSGENVEGAVEGVFTLAKTTGAAWAVGDPIYWDNAGKKTTKTATSNKFIGYATAAALSADTV